MNLDAFFDAPLVIQVHAGAAIAAFALAIAQFVGPKGSGAHRVMGWSFVVLMVIAASSAMFIQQVRPGQFSLIHLLVPFTLYTLLTSVAQARRGQVRKHRNDMIALFVGALVIAGALTLLPGRLMHAVLLG